MSYPEPIRELLDRVRARRRRVALLGAVVRAALGVAFVLGVLLVVQPRLPERPVFLAVAAFVTLALSASTLLWAFVPARRLPSNLRLARFIEERAPVLDDRLISAVGVLQADGAPAALTGPMLADAARVAATIDAAAIVPDVRVRAGNVRAFASLTFLSHRRCIVAA